MEFRISIRFLVSFLPSFPDIQKFSLLVFEFSKVMVSSQSSDLKNILELWESFKNFIKVDFLQTQKFTVDWAWHGNVIILIDDLEDETHITKVGSLVKNDNGMPALLMIYTNRALFDEIYRVWNYISSQDALILICMLIWQWCSNHCDQFIVSFVSKFRVQEKNVEHLLKWL